MIERDTFAHLPAVTMPIPAVPRPTERDTAPPLTSDPPTVEFDCASLQRFAAEEARRWSIWGAALHGARIGISRRQRFGVLLTAAIILLCLALAPRTFILLPVAFVTFAYLIAGVYKIVLLLRGERAGVGLLPELAAADGDLPIYTVLVPLLHERTIVPVLVERLLALDYPPDRLEVLLLVEDDDTGTLDALDACALPAHLHVVVVPAGLPRTKPRALNVGLANASGELIVVYDAEDRPERDQLRKAVAAFRTLPRRVVCLQARLNFYNRHQSLLTRLFAIDYATWYDMLLPGLVAERAVVPLGGTSNHFRVAVLRRMGGWDPYNVTEDADLGVRIARAGLQIVMLDSVTWEEAVARVRPWVRQRSRWIKGYIQTYLVHMRHPVRLAREIGPRAYLDFQLLVGGTSLMLLVNPVMWALTLSYFIAKGTPLSAAISALFPPALYYPALACLLANYVFFYTQLYVVVRRGYDDLARYALLGPLYWLLMSIGAWAGLISLIRHPHYWAKTEHGISTDALAPDSLSLAETITPASTRAWPATLGLGSLSVVLPAYNEEAAIGQTVRSVTDTLTRWGLAFEVVVVNDGSRDSTGPIVKALVDVDSRVRLITHAMNRGYGAALVTGFEAARNDLIFFMDSDGQFDIAELARFLPVSQSFDAVLGYRIDRQDTRMRRLNAWGWKQLVWLLLGVRVRDVDCAFKLFRSGFLRDNPIQSRSALINAELLFKLRRGRYATVQVGVRHHVRQGGRATGAKPSVIFRALRELVVYAWRWRVVARGRELSSRQSARIA